MGILVAIVGIAINLHTFLQEIISEGYLEFYYWNLITYWLMIILLMIYLQIKYIRCSRNEETHEEETIETEDQGVNENETIF